MRARILIAFFLSAICSVLTAASAAAASRTAAISRSICSGGSLSRVGIAFSACSCASDRSAKLICVTLNLMSSQRQSGLSARSAALWVSAESNTAAFERR